MISIHPLGGGQLVGGMGDAVGVSLGDGVKVKSNAMVAVKVNRSDACVSVGVAAG